MSAVTTHVLDAARGCPAAGMAVRLERVEDSEVTVVAGAATDRDGRARELGPERLPGGIYRLTFETGAWFAQEGRATFYPEVVVTFSVSDIDPHHHVPLLLAPYAYSTYRGS